MRVIIDRFEGNIAVVELEEQMLNVPRALFPGAKEGDAVEITVLGKVIDEGEEAPHDIFERLRRKRRSKRPKVSDTDAPQRDNAAPEDTESAADEGDTDGCPAQNL